MSAAWVHSNWAVGDSQHLANLQGSGCQNYFGAPTNVDVELSESARSIAALRRKAMPACPHKNVLQLFYGVLTDGRDGQRGKHGECHP